MKRVYISVYIYKSQNNGKRKEAGSKRNEQTKSILIHLISQAYFRDELFLLLFAWAKSESGRKVTGSQRCTYVRLPGRDFNSMLCVNYKRGAGKNNNKENGPRNFAKDKQTKHKAMAPKCSQFLLADYCSCRASTDADFSDALTPRTHSFRTGQKICQRNGRQAKEEKKI